MILTFSYKILYLKRSIEIWYLERKILISCSTTKSCFTICWMYVVDIYNTLYQRILSLSLLLMTSLLLNQYSRKNLSHNNKVFYWWLYKWNESFEKIIILSMSPALYQLLSQQLYTILIKYLNYLISQKCSLIINVLVYLKSTCYTTLY